MTNNKRVEKMEAMRAEGMTLNRIGEEFGISPQRVSQIIGNVGRLPRLKRYQIYLEPRVMEKILRICLRNKEYSNPSEFIRKVVTDHVESL